MIEEICIMPGDPSPAPPSVATDNDAGTLATSATAIEGEYRKLYTYLFIPSKLIPICLYRM